MRNIKQIAKVTDDLQEKGVQIAIDDFGTGKSNLILIAELNITTLKLDRSIIANITENKKMQVMVQGIIDICNKAKIHTVVEGIETKKQLDFIKCEGNEVVQGYYFSKPVEIHKIKRNYA